MMTPKISKAEQTAAYKSVCYKYVCHMQVLCASDSKAKIKSSILYGIRLIVNHRFIWCLQPFVQDKATIPFNIWQEKLQLKITVHKYL